MSTTNAIILGLIQGFTELLPISSSAHLLLFSRLIEGIDEPVAFDIALHLGSLISLLIYTRSQMRDMCKSVFGFLAKLFLGKRINLHFKPKEIKLFTNLIIVTIPITLFGAFFNSSINLISHNIQIVALNLAGWGILLIIADSLYRFNTLKITELTWSKSLVTGLFQMLSLIRGSSRSGCTIIGALSQGLNVQEAIKLSLLSGIFAISAAVAYQMLNFQEITNTGIDLKTFVAGIISSVISTYIAIKLLFAITSRLGFKVFGIYRILLGIILLYLRA